MKKKRLFTILGVITVFVIFILFFYLIHYKKENMGNNIINKNLDVDEKYILDINSYQAVIEVTVQSNKKVNKYIIKQEVNGKLNRQEVIEPKNLKGVEILYKDGKLTINNTSLNLNKVYENYPYVSENVMFLTYFLEKYKREKENGKTNIKETEEQIILTITDEKEVKKELYVRKYDAKPEKLIVQNNNKKDAVYILYKEINIENV